MFTPGRVWNPPTKFDLSVIDWHVEPPRARLEVTEDHSRSVLSRVDAPDLDFHWSLNPYRGCTHACAYCYAREYHEYLELGAGTDFERRIAVKHDAPRLLREAFERRQWRGELIAFSGATDCYQPLERRFGITRACLEVCATYRNPVTIITRSALIVRDVDLLAALSRHQAVRVSFSLPLVEQDVCRAIEPGAPAPSTRLEAMRALCDAGVPVGVSVTPLIPGLNDHTIPATLQAAREAGAQWATSGKLRLGPSVAQVFEERLRRAFPTRAKSVLARVSESGTNEPRWKATRALFDLWHRRLGYTEPTSWGATPFRRPGHGVQLDLIPAPG